MAAVDASPLSYPDSVRTLWLGTPRYVDASVQRLLAAARERPTQSLAGRELRAEIAFAALFVVVAVALLALAPSQRALSVPIAVALTLSYAIASRVEFETGVGSTVPTQLVFVPMLFLLPTAAVPLFVAAGLLLGRLPRYLTRIYPHQPRRGRARGCALRHRARRRPGPRRSRYSDVR